MGPAVTSKKWIQVCESRVKTVALSKAQLYNSKGRTRPNKAQNPEANVVVGQHLRYRHLPITADERGQVTSWTPMRILSMDLFCHYISVLGAKKKTTPANLWLRCVLMIIFLQKNLYDGVWAVVFALAGFAVLAHPDVVELLHGLLDDLWVIGQDASFEVSFLR